MKNTFYNTWAEVDLRAIRHNFRQLKKLKPKEAALGVVKADAYGHGMQKIAKILIKEKVDYLGVADLAEGILLRQARIKKPILLFENVLAQYAKYLVEYDLTPTVCTIELAQALENIARRKRKRINIHIKIDTGMGRLGIWHKKALSFIRSMGQLPHLRIEGIYTHFPVADTDRKFTQKQIKSLAVLSEEIKRSGISFCYVHAANSAGFIGYKNNCLNLSRPGLMIYGLYPHESIKRKVRLRPALTVKTRIVFLKMIPKGRSISYGRTFIAKRPMTIATLPIGYNDGYLRSFSNKGQVLVRNSFCPVVGRVTMDQIMVDVTGVKNVSLGDEVIVLGRQGKKEISSDQLAALTNTINYEVVCSLGNRLPRRYTQ